MNRATHNNYLDLRCADLDPYMFTANLVLLCRDNTVLY